MTDSNSAAQHGSGGMLLEVNALKMMSQTGVPFLAIVVFGYQPEIVNQLMKSLTALALHMAGELRDGNKIDET